MDRLAILILLAVTLKQMTTQQITKDEGCRVGLVPPVSNADMKLKGKVVEGLKVAALKSLPRQIPYFKTYIPYESPHFSKPLYIEILAPKINLRGVEYCHITIDREMKSISVYILD